VGAPSPKIYLMAEFVHDAQRDFWQSPAQLESSPKADLPPGAQRMADACTGCGTEYLIGAKFCHACGVARPSLLELSNNNKVVPESSAWIWPGLWPSLESAAARLRKISLPQWLRYLHFHEIKRWVGLPTASLVAFFTGLGCIAGALGISAFYKASNLAEFQAIQMWRMEWLLAAAASFLAGILLKTPSDKDLQ